MGAVNDIVASACERSISEHLNCIIGKVVALLEFWIDEAAFW